MSFSGHVEAEGDYVLPDNVPGNEFLNLRGMKTSTSRGIAVWLHEYLEKFPADYLRYGLAKVMPETRDSDFAWDGLQAAVNNELADTLGNFVNRAFAFAKKHFDGHVPVRSAYSDLDNAIVKALETTPGRVGDLIESYRFRDALEEAMGLARAGNKYFNDSEPWATRKSAPERCATTIHLSLQVMATLSVVLDPFIPHITSRLRKMLNFTDVLDSSRKGADGRVDWRNAGDLHLVAGASLGDSEILVNKLTDEVIERETQTLLELANVGGGNTPDEPYEPLNEPIKFDDFQKLDLRIGTVLEAEAVPKSKKLIRTQVDPGFEPVILAGVAEHLTPDELIGRQVVVVANLKPRKIFGFESQGMLLMAEDRDGRLVPVGAESEPGSVVR